MDNAGVRRHLLVLAVSLFLIVATVAVFWQVHSHEFLNYDDDVYVTKNPHIQAGLTWKGVAWAFTSTYAGNWHPLTWLSHMLDHELYGLTPRGHHLTSLLLHVVNTLLLFFVFERMTGAFWRSGLVAALFALHPVHVESVAWVAERKDVLSTFFWMMTMGCYVRYVKRPGPFRYVLVLLAFAMGLMSKAMLVTLPFVLLLMDYWPLGRFEFGRRDTRTRKSMNLGYQKSAALHLVWEKAPFFVLTAACSVVTFVAQRSGEAVSSLDALPLSMRMVNALVSYVTYLGNMIWPHNLAVFYPHPGMLPTWQSVMAGFLLVGISLLVMKAARRHGYLMTGWLWYLGTLVPVIGIVQVGAQSVADRYTYVPLTGLFLIIAWGVPELLTGWDRRKAGLATLTGALLMALMVRSWFQVHHWRNNGTLFEHAIKVTSNNYVAHNNLGNVLAGQGKLDEAVTHFSKALQMRPAYSEAHYNLGAALSRQGRLNDAIGHFSEAIRSNSDNAEAHSDLGVALAKQGKIEDAIAHFSAAVRIRPDLVEAHNNLGLALIKQGKGDEAIAHFSEALQIRPDYADAHYNLGGALSRQGKFEEAIAHFSKALQLKPDYAEAHNNLGIALAGDGRLDDAIAHFSRALQIKPDFWEAKNNLRKARAMGNPRW